MKIALPTSCLAIILLFTACFSSQKITVDNYHLEKTPPNGIEVAEDFYCDQTEIDNLSWREYMYWTQNMYGAGSEEYRETWPDTLAWIKVDSCLKSLSGQHLRNPAYNNYPVIGVSQAQAREYSKWRSDRVFEQLLIELEVIRYDTGQSEDEHFTLERYFNGELDNVISDKEVLYYPEFRLPTIEERQQILKYADSTDKAYFESCNSKYCQDCKENTPSFRSDIAPCVDDTLNIVPTRSVYEACASKNGKPIYNLRGNVAEWSAKPNITTGGGWRDKRKDILKSASFNTSEPNAWTGFRNVCEWKRWNE